MIRPACEIPGAAEVSLRVPPPLERQLTLERVDDGRVLLRDGDVIVAATRPGTLEFVWAALDCPTAFACDLTGPPIGREGRKQHAAQALWIEPNEQTDCGAATSRAPVASRPDRCDSLNGSPA